MTYETFTNSALISIVCIPPRHITESCRRGPITGLVRSNPLTALMQWGGRTHVLLAILHGVPHVQSSIFGPLMMGAWAVSEVRLPPA